MTKFCNPDFVLFTGRASLRSTTATSFTAKMRNKFHCNNHIQLFFYKYNMKTMKGTEHRTVNNLQMDNEFLELKHHVLYNKKKCSPNMRKQISRWRILQ